MKKLTRAIVLVCIFATILSSVAFAVVDLPLAPVSETYLVVPNNGDPISWSEIPLRSAPRDNASTYETLPYYSEVYTLNGQSATESTGYIHVRLTYGTLGEEGYVKGYNLVPASKMKKVKEDKLSYYASYPSDRYGQEIGRPEAGKIQKETYVKIVSTVNPYWVQVVAYVKNSVSYELVTGYVQTSGLTAY